MTYSINWPITVRSAVPFRSGNYYGPLLLGIGLFLLSVHVRNKPNMFLEASPIQQFHKRSLNYLNIITILITDATYVNIQQNAATTDNELSML